jgi:hypothetical protein
MLWNFCVQRRPLHEYHCRRKYRHHKRATGVILVRLAGLSSQQKAEIGAGVVQENGNRLIGSLTIVTHHQLRIRPLDIGIRLVEPQDTDT